MTGNWANIDGRLGLIAAGDASPLLYRAVGKPNRAGAREDFLMGCYHGTARTFAANAVVSERVGLLLPNATAAETALLAAKVTVDRVGSALTLRFAAPDGRSHTLSLSADGSVQRDGLDVK